jgi:hypothetical protein
LRKYLFINNININTNINKILLDFCSFIAHPSINW